MSRLRIWLGSPRVLVKLALASVVANVVIVVTGGAVRLTKSGLGCPTWPSCADGSLVPRREASYHGIIENTNRQLTFVLALIALATLVAALVQRRERRLAGLALGIIPAQAVIGGLSVLTDLNPWVVALHFLVSMGAIGVTMLLWWRVREGPPVMVPSGAVALCRLLVVVVAAVLVLGTVVTGSGPHAGDRNDSGRVHRTGLDVGSMSQLHADAVMVLIGLTIGLVALLAALHAPARARVASWWLLGAEAAQGVIGFTQYFTQVPAVLVGIHMLGACLVWIAALRMLLILDPVVGRLPPASDQLPAAASAAGSLPPAKTPAVGRNHRPVTR
ncbi:MAG: COX15/CtaA family protein [Actinomycetota bacterium]